MRCNLRVDEFPDSELAKLWREPITLMEIAARLGCMEWDVVRVARRMRLPSRKRCKKSSNLSVRDPTRMEITQRMLEVQARRKRSHSIVGDENSSPPPGQASGRLAT